ncbi:MAG: DNA polymerase I [Candidatus Omnitrophota bacterium]
MKPKLFLIDAHSLIFRSYYAIKNLSNSLGQPTGAVLGFVNTLNKILKENKPDYIAVCFDVSKETFRKKEYSDYKINRPPTPDALSSQFPVIKEIISYYKFRCLEKEGFEADDVIATLVERLKDEDVDIFIVSSDKDILQLVNKNVFVLNPFKDKEGPLYNTEAVRERFGITPGEIPDLISLMGDASDNIPSVRGIGEKTAGELIKEFHSVENLITNYKEVKQEKLRNLIKENVSLINLNKKLALLRKDVPVQFDLKGLAIKKPDHDSLYKIFKRLEFKSLMKALPADETPKNEPRIREIKNEAQLKDLMTGVSKNKVFAFYIEYGVSDLVELPRPKGRGSLPSLGLKSGDLFEGLNPDVLNLFLALDEDEVYELGKFSNNALGIFKDAKIKKIGHDLKSTMVLLDDGKLDLSQNGFDTMLAAYLIDPGKSDYSLSGLVLDHLDIRLSEPVNPANKASLIYRLSSILEKKLTRDKLEGLLFNVDLPLSKVLADVQTNGIGVDRGFLVKLSKELNLKLKKLIEDIYKLSGEPLNINSPKQLANVLFEKLKLPVIKKTKTGASTNEEVLKALSAQHELPAYILEYRQLTKIKSTYIDGTLPLINPKTNRLHTTFNQVATETGRLSSSEPNLQNIPVKTEIGRQIRKTFIVASPKSRLLSADYSQIELRILAHLSKDDTLIAAFKKDKDIHKITASLIFNLKEQDVTDEMRDTAKRINFGIVYGMSAFGLSRDLGIPQDEAASFIDAYFLRYPKVKDYMAGEINKAKKDGYVMTLSGRRRYIRGIDSPDRAVQGFAQRQAINTPIQGTASDLIKLAMINIHNEFKNKSLKTLMVLQIHDELLFEVPDKELYEVVELVRDKMQGVLKLDVPIRVDLKVGKNWLEMERVE